MKIDAYWKKKFIACGIFIFGSVLTEVITFTLMGLSMPRFFIINFSVMLVIAGLIFLIPSHVASAVLYSLVFLVQCIYSGVNVELYRIFGDIFTTDLLVLLGEAMDAIADAGDGNMLAGGGTAEVLSLWTIALFITLAAIMITAQVLVCVMVKAPKFSLKDNTLVKRSGLLFAFLFCFICFGSTAAAATQATRLPSDRNAILTGVNHRQNFDGFYYKVNYFKSFGTFSLFFKNVVLGRDHGNILQRRSIAESQKFFDNAPDMFRHDFGTSALNGRGMGPDAGNNVIVVMMESFDEIFVHPELTPAMYGLMYGTDAPGLVASGTHGGCDCRPVRHPAINFTNFHSQHKTDIAEAMVIFGSYPGNQNLVATWREGGHRDADTRNPRFASEYPFSVPNVLRKSGFESLNFFHPASGATYARQHSHTGFGFDDVFFNETFYRNSFPEEYRQFLGNWGMPEKVFFEHGRLPATHTRPNERAIDIAMPDDERFFSFVTTINGHWPYVNPPSDSFGAANFQEVLRVEQEGNLWINKFLRPDMDRVNSTARMLYRNAMARMMTMDMGLQFLLDELCERGLCDTTTLLVYTDHNAYGHDLKYIMTNTTRHMSPSFRVPAFLWSPNVHGFEVDKFMSPVDLVPTLFDILDIVVNPRMYVGHNAFDPTLCVSFSRLGVVFNDIILTDGMYTLFEAPHVTEAHREAFRRAYADLIYRWSFINRQFYPGNENFVPLIFEWSGKTS